MFLSRGGSRGKPSRGSFQVLPPRACRAVLLCIEARAPGNPGELGIQEVIVLPNFRSVRQNVRTITRIHYRFGAPAWKVLPGVGTACRFLHHCSYNRSKRQIQLNASVEPGDLTLALSVACCILPNQFGGRVCSFLERRSENHAGEAYPADSTKH